MATDPVAVIDAHGRHAQAVSFTRDGKFLVSTGQDAAVRLWSVPGFAAAGVFTGHKNSVNSLSFAPGDRILATGSSDKTVRLWSFPEGRCLHTLDKQLSGILSPDGDRLATVSVKGQVSLWQTKSGALLGSIAAPDKRITALAFTPNGRSLLIGGLGPIYRVAVTGGLREGELSGHKTVVACLRVSPDGKWLASTGCDGQLRIWRTKDWTEARSVALGGGGVLQVAFGPRSDTVTVASDFLIQTYTVLDGKLVEQIEVPLKGLYGVAISPDGRYLANAAADGRVRVWERTSGKAGLS